jgi:hypothetical protein
MILHLPHPAEHDAQQPTQSGAALKFDETLLLLADLSSNESSHAPPDPVK